jgi:nicotinate-nucleotide pyrophosphorylase (carboxylating)
MMLIEQIIKQALDEDLGLGDITTDNLFKKNHKSTAKIIAKQNLILCGVEIAKQVFETIDNTLKIRFAYKDGQLVKKNSVIMQISGSSKSILNAERTVLNFLQRLSGIATQTAKFVNIAKKYSVKVADTRKSLPGFRYLDKYAVRCGGGHNHRMSLADSVMVKDNHISAVGSIKKAVETIKDKTPHTAKIEVETKTLTQVKEAIEAGVDIIMLDNTTPAQILKAKKIIAGKAIVEVSGGITLENFERFTKTKPDVISIGSLTHSVKAADISLQIK